MPTLQKTNMDLHEHQLPFEEQHIVLRALAKSAAKPGCDFLEVGSWCGDSSLVLGEIAREMGGRLFCVDWWKGNVGTDLIDIAAKRDVFSYFWERICQHGLEDVVVPIRARSDVASAILQKNRFDLVFIDADHRYQAVSHDIQNYAPLVKRGGVLCGDDCEGHISDFDSDFLELGKESDYCETVHCGVVLAVGRFFKDYSIHYNIWSLRAKGGSEWEKTNLVIPGLKEKKQTPPQPLAVTKTYALYRYGKFVYGVPRSFGPYDVTEESNRNRPGILKTKTLQQAEQQIAGKSMPAGDTPVLVDSHLSFNLVQYKDRIYGLSLAMGDVDLTKKTEDDLKKDEARGYCVIGTSVEEVKKGIEKARLNLGFKARALKRWLEWLFMPATQSFTTPRSGRPRKMTP